MYFVRFPRICPRPKVVARSGAVQASTLHIYIRFATFSHSPPNHLHKLTALTHESDNLDGHMKPDTVRSTGPQRGNPSRPSFIPYDHHQAAHPAGTNTTVTRSRMVLRLARPNISVTPHPPIQVRRQLRNDCTLMIPITGECYKPLSSAPKTARTRPLCSCQKSGRFRTRGTRFVLHEWDLRNLCCSGHSGRG